MPQKSATPHEDGFQGRKKAKPTLARSSAKSGHTQPKSSPNMNMDCFPPPLPDNGLWQEKTHGLKIKREKKTEHFFTCYSLYLKMPCRRDKILFCDCQCGLQNSTSASFPSFFRPPHYAISIHPLLREHPLQGIEVGVWSDQAFIACSACARKNR